MTSYYDEQLAAGNLRSCYGLAPPRVQRYLRSEVEFVVSHLSAGDVVLDLGCGYGRTMPAFAAHCRAVVGADRSLASLRLARGSRGRAAMLVCTDAGRLGFGAASFDRVVCIQNGISAFHVDPRVVVREALRVLRPGGTALFSTYSDRFWQPRLDWFARQAAAGLIGEIDYSQTGGGVIVCRDGFRAATVREAEFRELVAGLDVSVECVEVDASSVFYLVTSPTVAFGQATSQTQ